MKELLEENQEMVYDRTMYVEVVSPAVLLRDTEELAAASDNTPELMCFALCF